MDPMYVKCATKVMVSELDLYDLSNGQTVEILTEKSTFWVTRTDLSTFDDDVHGARRMAVCGTDYRSISPLDTDTTRMLKVGQTFSVRRAMEQIGSLIEGILLPVGSN